MPVGKQVGVYVTFDELLKIDEKRGALSRSRFVRNLTMVSIYDDELVEKALKRQVE